MHAEWVFNCFRLYGGKPAGFVSFGAVRACGLFAPCGNCIVGADRFTVIDWDEAMLAPPERDAWFFMHRESRTRAIEEALAAAGLVSPSP